MAYLPTDPDLPTRSDFDLLSTSLRDVEHSLRTEIGHLKVELKTEIGQLRTELGTTNQRLDRMFLTLVGGLIVFVGTFVASAFFGPV